MCSQDWGPRSVRAGLSPSSHHEDAEPPAMGGLAVHVPPAPVTSALSPSAPSGEGGLGALTGLAHGELQGAPRVEQLLHQRLGQHGGREEHGPPALAVEGAHQAVGDQAEAPAELALGVRLWGDRKGPVVTPLPSGLPARGALVAGGRREAGSLEGRWALRRGPEAGRRGQGVRDGG